MRAIGRQVSLVIGTRGSWGASNAERVWARQRVGSSGDAARARYDEELAVLKILQEPNQRSREMDVRHPKSHVPPPGAMSILLSPSTSPPVALGAHSMHARS